ncbi:MAG: hypothetical protein WC374_01395 [Phycisphaerae bacterium]|jgi:hypothetical protein
MVLGELNNSVHRLRFLNGELGNTIKISDIDLALGRLAYHMENYLVRIYELRERLLELLSVFTGCDKKIIKQLKAQGKETEKRFKKQLNDRREKLFKEMPIERIVSDSFLKLLSITDKDIALRNKNTHKTFLCLDLYIAEGFYDPRDLLLDVQHQYPERYEFYKKKIRREIKNTIQRYSDKINTIIRLTTINLDNMKYIDK